MDERDYIALNKEMNLQTASITRVEVIDEKGRSYVNWKSTNKVELSLQDNGKTLKIYIKMREAEQETIFDSDDDLTDEEDFQPCCNCDLPDACADFGCAIKQGIRQETWE